MVAKNDPIKRWEKAAREAEGTGGLPLITSFEFKTTTIGKVKEALDRVGGTVIIAKEGIEETYVVMTMEKYFSLLPVNPNPKRVPRMLRHEGVLYREVV